MCHNISFTRRQDCQVEFSQERKSLYLSAGFSGMCMRKKIKGESDHEKTGIAIGEGTEREHKIPECEAEGF